MDELNEQALTHVKVEEFKGKHVTKYNIQEEAIPIKQGAIKGGRQEEFDKYSVYVDNVDYWCIAEELKTHFECCGIVKCTNISKTSLGTTMVCLHGIFRSRQWGQNPPLSERIHPPVPRDQLSVFPL